MIFADDWFDAVTAFETVYFWPDLPQAAVRGLQQAVLEETDGPGICAGERRLRQWYDYGMTIAPYENGKCACPVPWHRHSELPRGGDHLHAAPGDLNTYAAIAFGCPAMGKALAE